MVSDMAAANPEGAPYPGDDGVPRGRRPFIDMRQHPGRLDSQLAACRPPR